MPFKMPMKIRILEPFLDLPPLLWFGLFTGIDKQDNVSQDKAKSGNLAHTFDEWLEMKTF